MKRAKIYIGETAKVDMEYNIYRFKNKPAQMDLEYYLNINPITVISEFDENKNVEYGEIDDYSPFIDDKGEGYDFITYSAPFDFIFKQDFVIFHIGGNSKIKADRIIEVYTGNVAISKFVCKKYVDGAYQVELETINTSEIGEYVVIESNSRIALNKQFTDGYGPVKLGIHTRRLTYTDRFSSGVYKPVYKVIEKLKGYELYPEADTQQNLYHYTAIATTKDGKVSDVSNIASVVLAEDPNEVDLIVECSEDFYNRAGLAKWQKLDAVHAANAYRIDKADMYSRTVPVFNSNEIKADDSNVQAYHERILKMPNVWHRDKMHLVYRRARAYRLYNEYNEERSDYSETFFEVHNNTKVNIDKMVIYKKRVTYLDEKDRNIPIEIGDKDAELLKLCVRVGGRYYKDAVEKVDYQPIEIFSDNSRLPLINIKDRCLYSNHYNYTVYLYDEKGERSEPICVVL